MAPKMFTVVTCLTIHLSVHPSIWGGSQWQQVKQMAPGIQLPGNTFQLLWVFPVEKGGITPPEASLSVPVPPQSSYLRCEEAVVLSDQRNPISATVLASMVLIFDSLHIVVNRLVTVRHFNIRRAVNFHGSWYHDRKNNKNYYFSKITLWATFLYLR